MTHNWSSELYESQHSFVWKYGADLLPILNPRPGENILDVGCGTGQLTAKIAEYGAHVKGVDNSPDMIGQARQNFPKLHFALADIRNLDIADKFDAVFSNAALHWIPEAEDVVRSVAGVLNPQGRFVAEFGGKRNISRVLAAVTATLESHGHTIRNPWYFPSVGEYATLLEKHGFEVRMANHFERPTELEAGDGTIRDWLSMFGGPLLERTSPAERNEIFREVEERLRPYLHYDGRWHVDYVRLRIAAVYAA